MARQQAAAEVNAFVKGLVTEASPMTFPDNAAIDIDNMVLNRDGSITRRFGMDYESGYVDLNTFQDLGTSFAVGSYVWKNPGGYAGLEIVVVQTGGTVNFFDSSTLPVSANLIYAVQLPTTPTIKMSFTSVDGKLIVAEGSGTIYGFEYNGSSVSQTTGRLLIRDLFGVEDIVNGTNLLEGMGIQTRPTTQSNAHIYNLRNQTFAYPRFRGTGSGAESPYDTILNFFYISGGKFPANSDSVIPNLYANANDEDDRNTKRFFAEDAVNNPLGSNRAPVGYFIIDALNRGASRLSKLQELHSQYPSLSPAYLITSLPADSTPSGATVVASYGGRVFYAGFTSQVNGGDGESPRLGSYVLFSRLVQKTSDIYKCYQEGDPTSSETPDLVDTDGGFVRIDGAYNIQYMINVGDALMIVAENGVWKLTGGSGYGFKATDYLTSKITEHGSISANSVVLVDNTFMYWSDDGIYHVAQNQYGDWNASNLTSTTIQTYFDNIPYTAKKNCQGLYDTYQRRVRWLYNNTTDDSDSSKELVLDVNLSAFYPASIPIVGSTFPRLLSMIKVPPYETISTAASVVDQSGNNIVTSSGSNVTANVEVVDSALSEIYYVVATKAEGGTVWYSFAYYKDTNWVDWVTYDGTGVDAAAYMVTGWTGMGDFQRQKQVSYLTVYSLKTETGFDANYVPINASSVRVQGQWAWTNSAEAGKWTQSFQAYRHKRLWIPSSVSDGFDDGEYVVTTKNKLRGRGRVLSLKYSTEPGYNFHLLGWSYLGSISGTV